jgi:hypothetical protein
MNKIYRTAIPAATLGLTLSQALVPLATSAQNEEDEIKKLDEINRKNQDLFKKVSPSNQKKTDKSDQKENTATTGDTTTINGGNNVSVVISTPVAIAIILLVGGLALFPFIYIFLKSKGDKKSNPNSFLSKLTAKWRRPTVLESDAFVHKRDFDKLTQIAKDLESLDADRFTSREFVAFIKLKSQIAQKKGEYANFDEVIDFIKVSMVTQNSFLKIEQTESRYCSGTQQQLYKYTAELLKQNIEPKDFQNKLSAKLDELLPQLKTEEGQLALKSYLAELTKISEYNLGLVFLAKLKTYQVGEYSILRGIANTIEQVNGETVLDFDSLMMIILQKEDLFAKFGKIVGVEEEHNKPETYTKMIQYMCLQTRHEAAYTQFSSALNIMKNWKESAKNVQDVRDKYDPKEYAMPKEFTAEIPGMSFYNKYKKILKSEDHDSSSSSEKSLAIAG